MSSGADSGPSAPRKSIFGRLIDFIFGYDFFVSYCWADGRDYAVALVRQLQDQGFECFLDSSDYAKGDNWRDQGRRALRKTSRLILVATPKAMLSEPVQNELAIFSRLERRILPIDFDGSLAGAPADATVARYLTRDTLSINESMRALHTGPSRETIDAVRGTFNLLRQQQRRTRLLGAATVMFAVISLAAVALYGLAKYRQEESMALAWGAQGETIFEAHPVEGLQLARTGWKTAPDWSQGLNKRLSDRVLRLATRGRLTRVGTDILDAGLTADGQLFVARRHDKAEVRDSTDLRLIRKLPQRVREISVHSSGDHLVLGNQGSAVDLNYAFHHRNNGKLIGYRKHLAQPTPPFFPSENARYFYSDTGFSPTIRRLSDQSQIGHAGFDIMQFHYKPTWPVFALSYRDDENTRRPPDAELFDVHSGLVIHEFSSREIANEESRSGDYRVTRYTRPEDSVVEAVVYASASAYIIVSDAGLTLWHSGRSLTLPTLPGKISAGEIAGQPHALLLYEERSEVWSLADKRRLGEFPKLASADFISTLGGWLVTPSSPGSDSLLLKRVDSQLISKPMDARISWKDRRADAQGRYFVAGTDDKELQLRRTVDASLVRLPAPVSWFTFPRDASTPLFAVHYKGSRPSEIRRIADGGLVHTLPKGEVKVEFEAGEFFIVNHFKSDDRDSLYLSELRRNEDATLVATERDEIKGYVTGPGSEVLLLESDDGDLKVLLRSATGYQRINKVVSDAPGRTIFHPDPAKRTFVTIDRTQSTNSPEGESVGIHAVVPDDGHPGEFKVDRIDKADTQASTANFFTTAGTHYLLMAKEGERLALWRMDEEPRQIFISPVGLAGYLKLPGEQHFLLWYDDGHAFVIDVRLIDLASAAAESGDPAAGPRFLSYIEGVLFKSNWLDPSIIDQQRAAMLLD